MQHSDIFEYYHPFTAEKPPKAAPMFGWSAALFIEMALAETRPRWPLLRLVVTMTANQ